MVQYAAGLVARVIVGAAGGGGGGGRSEGCERDDNALTAKTISKSNLMHLLIHKYLLRFSDFMHGKQP